MFIRELAQKTGLSTKAIRYYESIGLLPRPQRAENNYRQYETADVERLRFIASARSLGFSLEDVAEFMAARQDGLLPCQRALDSLDQRILEVERRIADLLDLRETLLHIRDEASALPPRYAEDEQCVCYLLTTYRESDQVTIERTGSL